MTYRIVDKSQTLLLNEQSRLLESSGTQVIKFGFGQSPFSPPEHVIHAYRDAVPQHFYAPVQGIHELREAVAAFHNTVDGLSLKAENILIAPGSKMLIYAIIGMFERADILIPTPAWVSYAPQATLWKHAAIRIPTTYETKWNITPELLEASLKHKRNQATPSILILNYPGNPTGTTYTEHEMRAIIEICRKHSIIVISDEIYGLLDHGGSHCSLMRYYPEGTIVTTGLSKWCGAGGWRVGVALMSEEFPSQAKETLLGIASETYSCNNTPAQYAAIAAYMYNDTIDEYLKHQRHILSAAGNYIANTLRESEVRVYSPEGGFYLLPDFTDFSESMNEQNIYTSSELCSALLSDTGVALLPGNAFGIGDDHLAARLAYVDFDGQSALQASIAQGIDAPIDITFMQQHMPKIISGTRKICEWVKRFNM